ncbi:MAG: MerC domain-containing protein [Candidatus Binatia bacterium]
MANVDLVFDTECPNVPVARANLLRAFAVAGVPARWTEHRIGDPSSPEHTRGYGSPTVLVDGKDVAGVEPASEMCCRIYATTTGIGGAPGVEQIARALSASPVCSAMAVSGGVAFRPAFATVPGIVLSFLPNLACPACWPAYAGVLTSLGLGFLLDTRWLLPLTALFLLVAIAALAFHAERRRGWGPFFAGLVAALLVLVGKFALESVPAMGAGLGLLVGASIWNSWPRREARACPSRIATAERSRL